MFCIIVPRYNIIIIYLKTTRPVLHILLSPVLTCHKLVYVRVFNLGFQQLWEVFILGDMFLIRERECSLISRPSSCLVGIIWWLLFAGSYLLILFLERLKHN